MYSCFFAVLPLLSIAPKEIQEAGLNYRVLLMAGLQVSISHRLLSLSTRIHSVAIVNLDVEVGYFESPHCNMDRLS